MLGGCVWEYKEPLLPKNSGGEAIFFWKSDPGLDCPDIQGLQTEVPWTSSETARLDPPAASWSMAPAVVRPHSRGRLLLTGAKPDDGIGIEANLLGDPADLKAAVTAVELCRAIGNSAALKPFTKREVMPRGLRGVELESFVRAAVVPYWHYAGTAAMGRDTLSVVDGTLSVHGVASLRVADGSIMPRITTGNTMAPCVVIGERAAEAIRRRLGA